MALFLLNYKEKYFEKKNKKKPVINVKMDPLIDPFCKNLKNT